jgi:hypothetical protein
MKQTRKKISTKDARKLVLSYLALHLLKLQGSKTAMPSEIICRGANLTEEEEIRINRAALDIEQEFWRRSENAPDIF